MIYISYVTIEEMSSSIYSTAKTSPSKLIVISMKHQYIFWMSQSSKVLDFLTTIFWTLRYILRKQTCMDCCINSLFIQNIRLRGFWNHSLSDYKLYVITWKTFMKLGQFYSKCSVENDITQQISLTGQSEILEKLATAGQCPWSHRGCKSRRCQCCLYLDEKSHSSNDGLDFPIFGGLNCLSKNIIHIIQHKACGDKCVGETGRCLLIYID